MTNTTATPTTATTADILWNSRPTRGSAKASPRAFRY